MKIIYSELGKNSFCLYSNSMITTWNNNLRHFFLVYTFNRNTRCIFNSYLFSRSDYWYFFSQGASHLFSAPHLKCMHIISMQRKGKYYPRRTANKGKVTSARLVFVYMTFTSLEVTDIRHLYQRRIIFARLKDSSRKQNICSAFLTWEILTCLVSVSKYYGLYMIGVNRRIWKHGQAHKICQHVRQEGWLFVLRSCDAYMFLEEMLTQFMPSQSTRACVFAGRVCWRGIT
jgi:hypothetical protein